MILYVYGTSYYKCFFFIYIFERLLRCTVFMDDTLRRDVILNRSESREISIVFILSSVYSFVIDSF